jgi:hypothetical protein
MSAAQALARTILLYSRVVPDAASEAFVRPLTSRQVAIVVDAKNLASGTC